MDIISDCLKKKILDMNIIIICGWVGAWLRFSPIYFFPPIIFLSCIYLSSSLEWFWDQPLQLTITYSITCFYLIFLVVDGAETSLLVEGLNPGITYTVKVRGESANEMMGPNSEPVQFMPTPSQVASESFLIFVLTILFSSWCTILINPMRKKMYIILAFSAYIVRCCAWAFWFSWNWYLINRWSNRNITFCIFDPLSKKM